MNLFTLKGMSTFVLLVCVTGGLNTLLPADTVDQHSKLINAVHAQDFSAIQGALKAEESANLRDGEGNSALHIVCGNRCFHGGLLLLSHGADPNQKNHEGITPIDILIRSKLAPKSTKPDDLKHWLEVRVTEDIRNLIAKCRVTINDAAKEQLREAEIAGFIRPRDGFTDPSQDIAIPVQTRIIMIRERYRPYFSDIADAPLPKDPESAQLREAAIRLGNDAIWLSECAFGANSERSGWAKRRVWEVCGRDELIKNEKLDLLRWDTNAPKAYKDDPHRSQFDHTVWRYRFIESREALFQSFDEINRIDTWASLSQRKVSFLCASFAFHINVAEFLLSHGADPNLQFDESTWTALSKVICDEIRLSDTLPNPPEL